MSLIFMPSVINELKYFIFDFRDDLSIKREKELEIKNNDDLIGTWKDTISNFDDRYEAIIDKDSITLYKWEKDIKIVYFAGTFDTSFDIYKKNNINSINYKTLTDSLPFASHKEMKEFDYENGEISFISNYDDGMEKIILKKYDVSKRIPYDQLRSVKYDLNRKEYFDEQNNKKMIVGNFEISYPNYFDVEEEESIKNIIKNSAIPYEVNEGNINENMALEDFIVLSPSNTSSYAELFIGHYKNANIDNLISLGNFLETNSEKSFDNNYIPLVTYPNSSGSLDSIEKIYSTKYENDGTSLYGISYENWLLFKELNELLIIGTAYNYDDTSDYDYINDYKNIVKNVKIIKN